CGQAIGAIARCHSHQRHHVPTQFRGSKPELSFWRRQRLVFRQLRSQDRLLLGIFFRELTLARRGRQSEQLAKERDRRLGRRQWRWRRQNLLLLVRRDGGDGRLRRQRNARQQTGRK